MELTTKFVDMLEKHFGSPQIAAFGTYEDITAYTKGDITQPGNKLGNSSGAPERAKWDNIFFKCVKH